MTRVYVRDSLLTDMAADDIAQKDAGYVGNDQIGKVFIVVGQDVRRCLVCEQFFTRRTAAEHSGTVCHSRPVRS